MQFGNGAKLPQGISFELKMGASANEEAQADNSQCSAHDKAPSRPRREEIGRLSATLGFIQISVSRRVADMVLDARRSKMRILMVVSKKMASELDGKTGQIKKSHVATKFDNLRKVKKFAFGNPQIRLGRPDWPTYKKRAISVRFHSTSEHYPHLLLFPSVRQHF
jgi:hypothetical protein